MLVGGIYEYKRENDSTGTFVTITSPDMLAMGGDAIDAYGAVITSSSDGKQKCVVHSNTTLITLAFHTKHWDKKSLEVRNSAVPLFFALAPSEHCEVVGQLERAPRRRMPSAW